MADDFGAPMDVLWFGLSRKPTDSMATGGVFDNGRIFVMLNRGDYWQCAYVIPKGSMEEVRRRGIEAFRAEWRASSRRGGPRRRDRDWKQVHLLTVDSQPAAAMAPARAALHRRCGARDVADRRRRDESRGAGRGRRGERPGRAALREARRDPLLAKVQERREFPTRATQRMQLAMQNTVIKGALKGDGDFRPPLPLRLMDRLASLRRIPARLFGLGFRPEHLRDARTRAAQS